MAAPQKLGLDVVIDKHTGNLVTLEVNGLQSGYKGLKNLGEDLAFEIMAIIGKKYRDQKILINPRVHEFYGRGENLIHFWILRQEFEVELVFSPSIEGKISQKELEMLVGGQLKEYSALVGFGSCLEAVDCPQKMINSPAVELLTENKFIQYELLKDIPELNMPETILIDQQINLLSITELQKKYGKLVKKEINSYGGKGIEIIDKDKVNFQCCPGLEFFDWPRDKVVNLPVPILKREDSARSKMEFSKRTQETLEVRQALLDLDYRIRIDGRILQKFVDTLPVISEETGQPHYARARLIWFGKYLSGYWGLSVEPIEVKKSYNLIVNYNSSRKAQRFTKEEEIIFEDYAQKIVPRILKKIKPFEENVEAYQNITRKHFEQATAGRPGNF